MDIANWMLIVWVEFVTTFHPISHIKSVAISLEGLQHALCMLGRTLTWLWLTKCIVTLQSWPDHKNLMVGKDVNTMAMPRPMAIMATHCPLVLVVMLLCVLLPDVIGTLCVVVMCGSINVAYDCGIYALCYAEAVCQEQFQSKSSSLLIKTITAEQITQFRTKIKKLVTNLAN